MKNKIVLICLFAVWAVLPSCKKFLEVEPKSSLPEEQLFTSEVGFQQALTGIYSQMATRSLYGDNLSMGFVSALAQNYAVSGTTAPFVNTRALDFNTAEVTAYTGQIWNTSYAAIAGANKVILNAELKKEVLSAGSYALIKGEALGLRAYLHFELLRLFGPRYATGISSKAIPYKKTVDEFAVAPSAAAEVARLALADLEEAGTLMKGKDPVETTGRNRRIKMNYYAIKALEARIRIYTDDKPGAKAAAMVVVNSTKFPWVTSAAASAGSTTRDRLHLSEQVFALRVRDIREWAEDLYFRFFGSTNLKLTRSTANFATLYETASGGGTTDFRFVYNIEQDGGSPFPSKFWQTATPNNTLDSNRVDQLVPLIRISEMYYIMAESAATPAEGVGYLNIVRANRGLRALATTITQTVLNTEITKEYQKEFYAEGQLFYYYKRKGVVRMQFMTADIPLSKYVLPIPDAELEFNPNY